MTTSVRAMRMARRGLCQQREKWAALVEEPVAEGRRVQRRAACPVHIIPLSAGLRKIRGLGWVDPIELVAGAAYGEEFEIPKTQKMVTRLPLRLPELTRGLIRGAQTISTKDAGYITARLGIGSGDRILEAGLGSGGLAVHVGRCLGSSGLHVTVEPHAKHTEVGLANMQRARESWLEFPRHHHVEGALEEVVPQVEALSHEYDGIILDLPGHERAIAASAPLLAVGGRLACYCPVTSQVEAAWDACTAAGLEVEWAGELIEREWGRASKGGIRPVNGPFGHTAFLLIAQRKRIYAPPCAAPVHAPAKRTGSLAQRLFPLLFGSGSTHG
jgi:tRNA (adenine57-N1/adenine58-N1)-methyltransferase catalytic subunit